MSMLKKSFPFIILIILACASYAATEPNPMWHPSFYNMLLKSDTVYIPNAIGTETSYMVNNRSYYTDGNGDYSSFNANNAYAIFNFSAAKTITSVGWSTFLQDEYSDGKYYVNCSPSGLYNDWVVLMANTTHVNGGWNKTISGLSVSCKALKFQAIGCTDVSEGCLAFEIMAMFDDNVTPVLPVNITFISQAPLDINSTSQFNTLLNITYYIANANDSSTIRLEYMINSSAGISSSYFNGAAQAMSFNRTASMNQSGMHSFYLFDNLLYPASYNINETLMENSGKSAATASNNNLVMEKIKNINPNLLYTFLEVYASPSGTNDLNIYYCNSSYSSGLLSNPNCANFANIPYMQAYNHNHTQTSKHFVISLPFSSGKISGVHGTDVSYIVFHSGASGWSIYYNGTMAADADSLQASGNNGNSYSNLAGVADSHIHQFAANEMLSYRVCADDSCSSYRQDLLELAGLPPSSPVVYAPTTGYYRGVVSVNYTAAVSPNNYSINTYLIELFTPTNTFIATLSANNSPYLTYAWNTSQMYLGSSNISSSTSAYYKFEEGAGQYSYPSIGSITLNHSGSYSYELSKGGNATGLYAIRYNGVNGYSKAPSSDSLRLYNDSTIAIWVNPNITSANLAFVSKSEGSVVEYWMGTSGVNPYFSYRTHQNTSQAWASTLTMQNNTWQFFALTIKKISPTSFNYTFYLNDNQQHTSPGSTGLFSSGNGEFNLGRVASSYYTRAGIDNVLIFNRTLSANEIKQLYNYSVYSPSYVNDGNYTVKVTASDTNGLSAFGYSDYFIVDNTNPIMTVSSPNTTYNETYNRLVYINFSVSEPASCSINDSSFSLNYSNLTYYSYIEQNLTSGFHAVSITCYDYALNSASRIVYFTKDITYPAIFINYPTNGLYISPEVATLALNITFIDDVLLYDFNVTITPTNSPVILFSDFGLITGLQYNYTKVISALNLTNTSLTLTVRTCDAHTLAEIAPAKGIITAKSYIDYDFGKTLIRVEALDASVAKAATTKLTDRYTFSFDYSDTAATREYRVVSPGSVDYLYWSRYKAHFVIDSKYWLDFEQGGDVVVKYNEEDKSYHVIVALKDGKSVFNSIGELNCLAASVKFNKGTPPSPYNIDLLGQNWFNKDVINLTSTTGVFIYIFMLLIIIVFMAISFMTRIPFFYLFTGLMGFFFGWLLMVTLSAILGVLFIIGSIAFMLVGFL